MKLAAPQASSPLGSQVDLGLWFLGDAPSAQLGKHSPDLAPTCELGGEGPVPTQGTFVSRPTHDCNRKTQQKAEQKGAVKKMIQTEHERH